MSPARRLIASSRIATGWLVGAVALGVAAALLAVAQAALLATAIDGAFMGGLGVEGLAAPLVALAVVLALRAVLGWVSDVVAQRISGAVKADLRVRLLERAVALGPRWAADQASGEVALLATRGLDALDGYFGRYLPQLALAVIVPFAVVVCLFAVDVVAALTVAVTVPLIPVFMVLDREDVGGAPRAGDGRPSGASRTASRTSSPACRRCAPTAGPSPRWRSCGASPTPTARRRWRPCAWPSCPRWRWSCWRRSRSRWSRLAWASGWRSVS